MSIISPTNFNVQAQIHIDTRLTQADITARDLISTPTRYWGMQVHVLDSDGGNNPNTYILQQGTTSIDIFDNGNWIELAPSITLSNGSGTVANGSSIDLGGTLAAFTSTDTATHSLHYTGTTSTYRWHNSGNAAEATSFTMYKAANSFGLEYTETTTIGDYSNVIQANGTNVRISHSKLAGLTTTEFAGRGTTMHMILRPTNNGANEMGLVISTANGIVIKDDPDLVGAVYEVDYSAAGNLLDRWIPDYKAVKDYADSVAGGGGWAVTGTTELTGAVTIDTSTTGYDITFADTSAANDSDFAIGKISTSDHFRTFGVYVDNSILLRNSSNNPMLDLSPSGAAVFGLDIELGYATQTGSSRDIATKGTVPPYMTLHSDTAGSYYFYPSTGNTANIYIKGTFGDVGLQLQGGNTDLIEGGYDSGNPLTIQARQQLTQDGQAALILRTEDTTRTNDDSGNVEIRTGAPDGAGVAGDVFIVNDTTEAARFKDGGIQLSGEPTQTFKTAHVQLTQGQIQSLNTTPIEIIALPGSGKYIQIIGASANYAWNSTSYVLSGGTVDNIQLSQGAQVLFGTHLTGGASMIVNPGNKIRHFQQQDGTANTAPDIGMNIAIDIDSLSDYTGAGGTIDVYVQYVIIDTN